MTGSLGIVKIEKIDASTCHASTMTQRLKGFSSVSLISPLVVDFNALF
jgi:hypothetical protein